MAFGIRDESLDVDRQRDGLIERARRIGCACKRQGLKLERGCDAGGHRTKLLLLLAHEVIDQYQMNEQRRHAQDEHEQRTECQIDLMKQLHD
ncbi:hypothetical protein [Cohnella rhizosphaerae]|uniref:Uncharacterized protein n=1 Tax=Cohnella rhizosphaerae TaxID=1457232 RepID=A0A9X4QTU3_9BACL|nr:hypothetical protein [Cohnella rhizosphaerae]MDG0809772.1 hypothetical protein [Cohnella rhizosphaerae]